MDNKRVSIITLNWNGWQDTINCLESVFAIDYPAYEVIVVDNGSSDNSTTELINWAKKNSFQGKKKKFSNFQVTEESKLEKQNKTKFLHKQLTLIKASKNYGYAIGNNIALRLTIKNNYSDYVLLLNNDTYVDKYFLKELVTFSSNHQNALAGSKILNYNDENRTKTIQSMGSKLSLFTGSSFEILRGEADKPYLKPISVDYVWGASLLISRSILEKIGVLEERYFTYVEDAEYCYRARRNGIDIFCVPRSKIWHRLEASSKKISGFRIFYRTRNLFWFEQEYATAIQYLTFLIYYFIFRFPKYFLGYIIVKRDKQLFLNYTRAVYEGLFKYER